MALSVFCYTQPYCLIIFHRHKTATLGSYPHFHPPNRGTHRKILRRISGIEKANEKVLEGKAVISLPMQEHIDKELGIAFRGAFVISCQCLQPARLMAEPSGEVASCSSLWDKAISSISIVFFSPSLPLTSSPSTHILTSFSLGGKTSEWTKRNCADFFL